MVGDKKLLIAQSNNNTDIRRNIVHRALAGQGHIRFYSTEKNYKQLILKLM